MFIHWLNGGLVLEPENPEERRALLLLWKQARPKPRPVQYGEVSSSDLARLTGRIPQAGESGGSQEQPTKGDVLGNLGDD